MLKILFSPFEIQEDNENDVVRGRKHNSDNLCYASHQKPKFLFIICGEWHFARIIWF